MGLLPVSTEVRHRAIGTELSRDDLKRFSRHILLPEVGLEGQRTLRASRVLVIGMGGLGAPATLYLAAAGIGCLGLVDGDVVDLTNLQRQVLYKTGHVGQAKVVAATSRLLELNPALQIETHPHMINAASIIDLVAGYDLVVDGTDNFTARYLISDACVLAGKPYVYGSISRFSGQASVFYPPHGPCYRCLFPNPPAPGSVPSCAEGGVLGVLPGVIGSVQATEAIKLLAGIGEPLLGRLLTYDALSMRCSELRLSRDASCQLCGDSPTIRSVKAVEGSCLTRQGPGDLTAIEISLDRYHAMRSSLTPHQLIDVRGPTEAAICSLDGSLLVPLSELPRRLSEIGRNLPTVVHCKVGGRSAKAVEYLREQGFEQVWSLRGGILAWIDKYDPALARY